MQKLERNSNNTIRRQKVEKTTRAAQMIAHNKREAPDEF